MNNTHMRSMGWGESILLFGIPTVIFFVVTRLLIPYFNRTFAIHPVLTWFIFGGFLLFVPIFLLAVMLFRHDKYEFNLKTMAERFRLVRLKRADWLWFFVGLAGIVLLTGLIMGLWRLLSIRFGVSPIDTSAPFLHFEPLKGTERLLLLAWVPFFFFNIMGEELLWRGYILPRQELRFGKFAWMVNAFLWFLFHICFGVDLLVLLVPVLFVVPYVVQKRKNTWIGIMIHAIVNGPSFILISLGLLK